MGCEQAHSVLCVTKRLLVAWCGGAQGRGCAERRPGLSRAQPKFRSGPLVGRSKATPQLARFRRGGSGPSRHSAHAQRPGPVVQFAGRSPPERTPVPMCHCHTPSSVRFAFTMAELDVRPCAASSMRCATRTRTLTCGSVWPSFDVLQCHESRVKCQTMTRASLTVRVVSWYC